MGSTNSRPDYYLGLMEEVYRDVAERFGVAQSVQRVELGLIRERHGREGLSFMTKTLPCVLGKAVDTALAKGTQLSVPGFEKIPDTAIPKFLGWLLNRVFDARGCELSSPDPNALLHFRQLVYLLYKLEMPHSPSDTEKCLKLFRETDEGLPLEDADPVCNHMGDTYIPGKETLASAEWLRMARHLVSRIIAPLDPYDIKPRHGPGAVATGETATQKSVFKRMYGSLERIYPFTEWFVLGLGHVAHAMPALINRLESVPTPTAKVVLVPKDSRGPRLISCEPLEVQWIQQGLGRSLIEHLERSRWTKGYVNFTDQKVNRALALEGSKNGQWVTLDMKEASDRVSLALVKYLFQDHPRYLEALLASRSTSTRLPDGTEIPLRKFAPMGSALCFPVESLIFWVLSVCAIRYVRRVPLKEALTSVYVYGDDIIVRQTDYTSLTQLLPLVGLKFNEGKCCTARFFRESCGCDAYVGVDVTPVKIKTVWSDRRQNPSVLASYVALRNAMFGRGYYHAADYVAGHLCQIYGERSLPYTDRYDVTPNGAFVSTAGGHCFVGHAPATKTNRDLKVPMRVNRKLQRLEILAWTSTPLKVKTRHDGYAEWLRRFSDGYGAHGGDYALVRRNYLKRTWVEV
jgi:hypothetical protein